jgi:hypothetical protein
MSMESAYLRQRLERVRAQLVSEVGDEHEPHVGACFEQAVRDLLPSARITDFLPALVERRARACMASADRRSRAL